MRILYLELTKKCDTINLLNERRGLGKVASEDLIMRIVAIFALGILLAGCSRFYGVAPRGVLKTAGNLSIVSTALVMGTNKTLSDHLASYYLDKNCSTVRIEKGRTYCKEDEPNPQSNLQCYRTLGDVMCYDVAPKASQPGDRIDSL